MTDDPLLSTPSRRRLLATAGAIGAAGMAGCLDDVLSSNSGRQQIEPEEPSEPREGSPGEFYYFLEDNGIDVDSLHREDDDLFLVYDSGAETVDESNDEITVVYEVFRQALVDRGSDVEMLIAEVADPFDGQAHGWGVDAELARSHSEGEAESQWVWNSIANSKVDGDGEPIHAEDESDDGDEEDGDGDD